MNLELRNQKESQLKPRRGFTLIELIVSIAIFITITSVVMVSQRRFGGQILISNLAYDIALGIHQAQVYGISVKAISTGEFTKSYGIHFQNSKYYILFVDTDDDGIYDISDSGSSCIAGGECISFYRIEQGNSITSICATGSPSLCSSDGSVALDVTFKRPEPEPVIRTTVNGGVPSSPGTYSTAYVVVMSPQGLTRKITVLQSGQVSVLNN